MISGSTLQLAVSGLLVPAAVSFGTAVLLRWMLPRDVSSRYALAAGFAAAFCAGYALLPDTAGLVPDRHWHWLFYVAAAAAFAGPLSVADTLRAPERWLIQLGLAFAAAWLLVPTWPSLEPARAIWVPVLAGGMFLTAALLSPLPERVTGCGIPALLCLAAFAVAGTTAAVVSVTYGRLAGVAAGALLGTTGACALRGAPDELRGLLPAYATVVGGVAFVACVEPREPVIAILLMPTTPLALWLCIAGPLKSAAGSRGILLRVAAATIPLAMAVAWAITGT